MDATTRDELLAYFAERTDATIAGIEEIGDGYEAGHDGEADYHRTFYRIDTADGDERLMATGNGDPCWCDEDAAAFEALAESCGVDLDA